MRRKQAKLTLPGCLVALRCPLWHEFQFSFSVVGRVLKEYNSITAVFSSICLICFPCWFEIKGRLSLRKIPHFSIGLNQMDMFVPEPKVHSRAVFRPDSGPCLCRMP